MKRIPVAGPSITEKEIRYVEEAVRSAWYENANIYHEKFAAAFCHYVGRKYAVLLPSCTAGLHLALAALNISKGDEVLVPDITWIATSAPIEYVGGKAVLVDIDQKTWCIDPESVKKNITPKTKAIIAVDLYGSMPEMLELEKIAREYNIALIEDAAEAVGSEYQGEKAGSFGEISVFSFHGSKTLTTGEGGILLTDDPKIFNRVQILRDHGRIPGDRLFYNQEIAYKYKMSSMQAALGLAQLERVEELVAKKRKIFSWYKQELEDLENSGVLTFNHEPQDVKNSYWMSTIILNENLKITKEDLINRMKNEGIDLRPFFYPLSSIPAYQNYPGIEIFRRQNTNAYRISPYGVNLPSGMNLDKDQVRYVCQKLNSILFAKGLKPVSSNPGDLFLNKPNQ